jgi:DNA-binding CsgD family transcriptional regulator
LIPLKRYRRSSTRCLIVTVSRTQREIAKSLELAGATVKTHLLDVFEKTGVRRQVDLVRLVASLASPV